MWAASRISLRPALAAQLRDLLQAAGVTAQAHEHDGPRAGVMRSSDGLGIEAQVLVDVGENRPQVLVEDRVVGRDEGQRRSDDLVAVVPAVALLQQPHGQVQSGGGRVEEVGMGETRVALATPPRTRSVL